MPARCDGSLGAIRSAMASLSGPAFGVSHGTPRASSVCAGLAQEAGELGPRPPGSCGQSLRMSSAMPGPYAPLAAVAGRRGEQLRQLAHGVGRSARSARRGRSSSACAMTSSSSAGAPHSPASAGMTTFPSAVSSRCRCGSPVEKAPAGAELPEHDAEGVEVDAAVAHLLARDLGRDVPGLGEDDPGDRVAPAVVAARGAEVDELDLARVAHHHVLRREVAVDDAEGRAVRAGPLVHVGERLGHFDGDGDRVGPARCACPSGWRAAGRRSGRGPRRTRPRCTARRRRRWPPRGPGRPPGAAAAACTRASSRNRARNDPSWMWSRRTVLTMHARSAPSMPVVAPR